jgi:hypothetical protein
VSESEERKAVRAHRFELARRRLPGVVALLATVGAGLLAVRFAALHKPHVFWHTLLAYGLLLILVLFYLLASIARKPWFRLHLWGTVLLFAAVLVYVHLDDAPGLVAFDPARGWLRPAAPELFVAAVLDGVTALAITVHLLTWDRRSRTE